MSLTSIFQNAIQRIIVHRLLFLSLYSEAKLLAAYESVKNRVEEDLAKGSYEEALVKIASLRDSVDALFEGVLVMADDQNIRRNRLMLIERIAALFGNLADFSKLST
jgi:glycyl-tRNA synthetase beta chain